MREAAGENEYAYVNNSPTNFTDALGLYPGEGGGYNALNDMGVGGRAVSWYLDGDQIARDSWTVGNYCAPFSERMWAGVRLGWTIISNVFGAKIISKAFGIFKLVPFGALSKAPKKGCFVAGTLVHTKGGLKPIEQLKAKQADGTGDEVLSYNEREKRTEYKPIIETYVRQTEAVIRLEIEGETTAIETTAEHPFYVRVHRARDALSSNEEDEGEWRGAGSLQAGDEVRSANGEWRRIVTVEQQARDKTVYNFAVQDNQNYFVSNKGFLVHNTCDDLALGLGKYVDKSGASHYLDDFAKSVDAETYVQKANSGLFIPEKFLQYANNAETIHFNLKGFSFKNFAKWIKAGDLEPSHFYNTVTNYELYTVLTNPALLNKTKFYMFP